MKRPIKSFADVEYIIKYKCDVRDPAGHVIPFVRFLGLTLVELMNDVFPSAWTYYTED